MYPARFEISLRITHPSMDPEDISTQLRLKASTKWKAGLRRTTPVGTLLAGTNDATFCVFELDAKTRGHLDTTLNTLTKKLFRFKHFFQKIRSTGGSIEYFIGLFVNRNTGIILDRSLMAQLVNLGIDLSLDIYASQPTQKKAARRTVR
ncbi:MAG: DUF4279 domain-containing protein [Nitrospira sp.]|nr:MAG: DUF4279 domain-containing protein [Nitrospira sp.]